MNAIIVSDLHIGSRYFSYEGFECFLQNISEDHELILNGDILDNLYAKLTPSHQQTLDVIKQVSYLLVTAQEMTLKKMDDSFGS